MPTVKEKFENKDGLTLAALLEAPEGVEPHSYGIFAHCFTCNKNYQGVRNISRAMSDQGIAMLAIDFAGLGESEGEFSDTSFSTNVDDLIAAAEFLSSKYQPPKILVGHSMGGAAVLCAGSQIPSVKAVTTLAAPAETTHLRSLLPAPFERIDQVGEADVTIGGVKFRLTKQFVDDLEQQKMKEKIYKLNRPLMIVHSAADATVEVENAEKIYQAAQFPKALITLDFADHLLSNERDSRFVGEIVSAWSQRYLLRGS